MDKEILVAMAYLTSGVPPHELAADPLLGKVAAYNEGQVPAGRCVQAGRLISGLSCTYMSSFAFCCFLLRCIKLS